MTKFISDRSKGNFTVVNNTFIRDRRLSLKARGLFVTMLSLPDDWVYSKRGLASLCKENISAVTAALRELSELGYVEIKKYTADKTESKHLEYEYIIREIPLDTQKVYVEKVDAENVDVENVDIPKRNLLNTNIQNTKQLNIKKLNTNNKYNINSAYSSNPFLQLIEREQKEDVS